MAFPALLVSQLAPAGPIVAVMAAIAAVEVLIPLHPRARAGRAHVGPNLALTLLTFVTYAFYGAALVLALAALQTRGLGLLPWLGVGPSLHVVVVLLALDLVTYAAHVAMHAHPALWRVHRVHHADAAVDVTTTLRQHPLEGLVRFAFLAAVALPLGASPAAFAAYRGASALTALLEHANIRLPRRLDDALSLVVTFSNYHKVHHARDPRLTDTNYGNLVSWWDRLFGTHTPARHGVDTVTGLEGWDDPADQKAAGLLAMPFRSASADSEVGGGRHRVALR